MTRIYSGSSAMFCLLLAIPQSGINAQSINKISAPFNFTATDYVFAGVILSIGIISFVLHNSISLLRKSATINTDSENVPVVINPDLAELREGRNLLLYALIFVVLIFGGYRYGISHGNQAYLLEWLNLIVRWAHVVFGIAWIGASFYFIFLENSLNRKYGLRDELAGNLWAIHGGGFYYVEKYKHAPAMIPKKLHWFKYEAYFTWLTGFILLIIVYYLNGGALLTDPSISNIATGKAIVIGIGSLVIGWFIYDLLCKSSLVNNKNWFAFTGFLLIILVSFCFSKIFSGRAAFMHVGAILGTIMAGNVFFVIIPSQKALVRAALEGKLPDGKLGQRAGLRSLHNNYITFPVIFIMISNHFPSTFATEYNWAILATLTLVSGAIRHFINKHEQGVNLVWIIPASIIALLALVLVTSPKVKEMTFEDSIPVSFSQVQPIFQRRCATCHSVAPTDDVLKVAPNGILLDTPDQIKKVADRIMIRVVQTKTMPLGNKTHIADEERVMIGRWIRQGAKIE